LLLCLLPGLACAAEIPQGAHVLLRMVNSISTRTAKVGDYVYLRTNVPIVVKGEVVAPAESYVQGVVSFVRRPGRVSGSAQLGIRLDTLTLRSGRVYRFSPRLASVDSGDGGQKVDERESAVKQGGQTGQDAARIAITAGTGAALGAMVDRSWRGAGMGAGAGTAVGIATALLSRGREVELRQGSTLDVMFDRAVPLE
jgi:type IV secretion system protein VirB10